MNKDTCVRRQSCAPIQYTSVNFVLDAAALRKWYELSDKFVYYVTNLKLTGNFEVSPCDGDDSRWLIHDTPCGQNATNFTSTATKATIIRLIKAAGDASNPYVIDVDVTADGGTCTDTDGDTIGAMVTISGKCYQNVHPDEVGGRVGSLKEGGATVFIRKPVAHHAHDSPPYYTTHLC